MNFDYNFIMLKPPSWPSPRGKVQKAVLHRRKYKKAFPPWGEIERGVITKKSVT